MAGLGEHETRLAELYPEPPGECGGIGLTVYLAVNREQFACARSRLAAIEQPDRYAGHERQCRGADRGRTWGRLGVRCCRSSACWCAPPPRRPATRCTPATADGCWGAGYSGLARDPGLPGHRVL